MRGFLLIVSALGVLVFGTAFAMSMAKPRWVESMARDLIRAEVERRVGKRIDALDDAGITRLAGRMSARNQAELERLRTVRSRLPDKVAAAAAEMGGYDCECRQRAGRFVDGVLAGGIERLSILDQRVGSWIRSAYGETAAKLMREFRIFTGANALVFVLLGAVAMARSGSARQLLLPALVLIGAAAITAGVYLFGQDWVRTLVFGDYLGYWYFGYLSVAVAFLADVALNRARITTRLVGSVSSTGASIGC